MVEVIWHPGSGVWCVPKENGFRGSSGIQVFDSVNFCNFLLELVDDMVVGMEGLLHFVKSQNRMGEFCSAAEV